MPCQCRCALLNYAALAVIFIAATDAARVLSSAFGSKAVANLPRVASRRAPTTGGDAGRQVIDEFDHEITAKDGTHGTVSVQVARDGNELECIVTNPFPGQRMWLHWGFAARDRGWYAPPDNYLPHGTNKVDDKARQSPLTDTLSLRILEDDAPEAIAFVLKKESPEEWYSGPTGDFWIAFKPADSMAVGATIMDREVKSTHWSILDRMRLVGENIKSCAESEAGMSWLYTLLRFHQIKLLPLTRKSNYQSKDLASAQNGVSTGFAAIYGKFPETRMWSRLCIQIVPRGGGNGDAIRLEILDIMRRHGIKEGHRPGIEDKFLEEWHQKLHTNCAPDDIIIAEAYIKFLETNNPDDYWGYLNAKGLSYEYMSNIGGGKGSANSGLAGLTHTPLHLPQLINDIKHLRWTLMQVHGGADLDFMIEKARRGLDDEVIGKLLDIQQNRHDGWVPGKIIDTRRHLQGLIEAEAGHRDGLMLDCALESWFITKMTESDKGSVDRDDLLELLALSVEHMALSFGRDWWQCKDLVYKLNNMERWGVQWSRQAKAVLERLSLALQAQAEDIYAYVQPKAEEFGKAIGAKEAYITNFAEEVIRGSGGLVLSQILSALSGHVRAAGQVSVWELASSLDSASGELQIVDDLRGIQGKSFDTPQVFMVSKLGGIEDIPPGVVAILTPCGVDVLSHIAIRARNQKVLLASCHDDGAYSELVKASNAHKHVRVKVDSGMHVMVEAAAFSADSTHLQVNSATSVPTLSPVDLAVPKDKLVLMDSEFRAGCVGGKSNNLQTLRTEDARTLLGDDVSVPTSVALPFGVLDEVLALDDNAAVRTELTSLEATLSGDPAEDEDTLLAMRDALQQLVLPSALYDQLVAASTAAGIPAHLTEDGEACFDAMKLVWSSKWSSRATYSRRACSFPDSSFHMAILVQQVIAADYAFVLHTHDPVSKDEDTVMGEICVGLGEALVANFPGRALSFTYNKKTHEVSVRGFASKRLAVSLTHDSLIFRSDSNGEDLEGFAGAGLYDSVLVVEPQTLPVDYTNDKLMWDDAWREHLLAKLGRAATAIETITNSAQDIEGVVQGDRAVIVQLRPQHL